MNMTMMPELQNTRRPLPKLPRMDGSLISEMYSETVERVPVEKNGK